MKYILTIDDDEALCKLVKKCIETEQVPVYTFLRGGSFWSGPSAITRIKGSVPEDRKSVV